MDDPQVLAEIRRLLARGSGPQHTVREIVERYIASVRFANLKNRANEAIRFRLHIVPHLGDDIAGDLHFDRLAWYREQRKAEKCQNGRNVPPSAATLNREVMQLSAALTWAAKNKPPLLGANPIRGAPMEVENNQRQTMPDAADVERIMFASSKRLRAMIATKFWSGLRRGELCGLRLVKINWDDGLIVLHGRETKTGRPRVTVFPDRASRIVGEYLDERARG